MKITLVSMQPRPLAGIPPLAAGSLAAALPEPLRRDLAFLDLPPACSAAAGRQAILDAGGALVIFLLTPCNRPALAEISRLVKESGNRCRLVAAGIEAAAAPLPVLQEGELDGVIWSEGEATVHRLVERLAAGEDPAATPGLLWRTLNGPVFGPPAAPLRAEELPSPWLTGVLAPPPGGCVRWEISRGSLPGSEKSAAPGLRHLPLERLQTELRLFAEAGVAEVRVIDPCFNFPPERGHRILQLLAESGGRLHFTLHARAEFLDRQTVLQLSRLSCLVRFDLVSAAAGLLEPLQRPFHPELFAEGIHLLAAEDVPFAFDLAWGLPGDNPAGFRASLDWALSLRPGRLELFPLAPRNHPAHRHPDFCGLPFPLPEPVRGDPWRREELEEVERLAAVVDLFYNRGRAAPFFPALLPATGCRPGEFFDEVTRWALGPGGWGRQKLLAPEEWSAAELLALQENAVSFLLQQRGRGDLVAAALDLIRFHFQCEQTRQRVETALAPAPPLPEADLWHSPWQLAPQVRLARFSYEILDLQEMGEFNLEEFASLFRPVGSVAVFLHRDGQVFCESLEENFQKLLTGCDGRRTPREIFDGTVSRREGMEIVEFAVGEGLLVPA